MSVEYVIFEVFNVKFIWPIFGASYGHPLFDLLFEKNLNSEAGSSYSPKFDFFEARFDS